MLVLVTWWYFYDYVDMETIGFEKLGSHDYFKSEKLSVIIIVVLRKLTNENLITF